MTSVLILGATGYVGGSLLIALKQAYPSYTLTALVRSPASFFAVTAAGATPVQGTFSEHAKISALAADADVVINTGDSDDDGLIQAILTGLRRKYDGGCGTGALIHTSGTGLFLDGKKDGMADLEGKIWDDGNEDVIKSITPAMLHGSSDVSVMKAGEEGYLNTFIVCPPLIYGVGTGPTVKTSNFYKYFINSVLKFKHGYIIGDGSNIIDMVHVSDVVALFVLVFRKAVEANLSLLASSPYSRYYIASARTINHKTIMSNIAGVLHKKGLIESPELKKAAYSEIDQLAYFTGANSRTRAVRAYELGWVHKEQRFETLVKEDIEQALEDGVGKIAPRDQPWPVNESAEEI
ncbi:hypothetical protein M0805_001187 [Coniferiporia weirii]|nr:hypothetical protein M0805_001187 [Coniferiporia weirii]